MARMTHRGACSADNDSGDGAGALLGLPHSFYADKLRWVMMMMWMTMIIMMKLRC